MQRKYIYSKHEIALYETIPMDNQVFIWAEHLKWTEGFGLSGFGIICEFYYRWMVGKINDMGRFCSGASLKHHVGLIHWNFD